jgi:hypothetical protein
MTKAYSKMIKEQIGCGYCKHEKQCPDHDPKVNKAKAGCLHFKHHSDNESKQ